MGNPKEGSSAPNAAATDADRCLAGIAPPEPVEVGTSSVLRSARMLLRPLTPGDRAEYLRSARASAEALAKSMPLYREGESDDQMFDRQIRAMAVDGAAGRCFRTVGILGDGRIAGGFNLNAITRGLEFRADITWWIASDLTGRGLASEGVRALLDYGLADLPDGLGLHTIAAWITDDNTVSMRVAEKAGLVRQPQEKSYLDTGNRWALHQLFVRRAGDHAPG